MMWEKIIATDYCESVRDGTHDTPKQTTSGKRLVTSKHIKNGAIYPEEGYFISEKDYDKINERSKVEQWDVLMTMIGNGLGTSAVVKSEPDYAIKNIALFKCGNEVKAKWLHYYLSSNIGQGVINNSLQGSGQPFISLSLLRNFMIPAPPSTIMKKSVSILSAYDDLIENNQKQIKLLEEAAMWLYKDWFVYLRFPGYENTRIVDGVPERWERCVLDDVINFGPTERLEKDIVKKSVPMAALNTNSMVVDEMQISVTTSNAGTKFRNYDTLLARITPCLENGKTAFVNFLEAGETAVGSTEFIVMRSKRLNPYMVYCIARSENFRSEAINSMTGADGRQRAKVDKLKAIKYLLPDERIIELCNEQMEPLFDKIRVLNKQSCPLRQARDMLLLKLISGEIEVNSHE